VRIVDAHVHLWGVTDIENMNAVREHVGAQRMGLACTYHPTNVNSNPAAFAAKAAYPESFYVFAGLDHSTHFSAGSISAPSLPDQVEQLMRIGADGIKLLETKPDRRKALGIAIDDGYFEGLFSHVEEARVPLLWHVADPPEFWDPSLTPGWAAKQGWGYDDSFTPYERLKAEVSNVLRQRPRLRVIFPHFFFVSQDLPQAADLLDRYQGVHLDLAPGIEMYYNLSRDVDASHEFLEHYSDRIIFGTDIFRRMGPEQAALRAGIVRRFLETADEFRVPEGSDYLLGPPEDGVIRGMQLSAAALKRIYHENVERLLGPVPHPLRHDLATDECERILREVRTLGGDTTEAEGAVERLAAAC